MEYRDTEFAVCVNIGVVEGTGELEGWWGIGVVFREGHVGFEVAAVVEGVRVYDYKGDVPVEDVILFGLEGC